MLLALNGRAIAYDLLGAEGAPVVCFTHSLAADGGMWAEQVPPLLAAGFRVLRLDMRGHGGSAPVPGPYTMSALAGDVAGALDVLGIARVHFVGLSIGGMLGQAFALEHPGKLISAIWCDTRPATPGDGISAWAERIAAVEKANSVAPLAEATVARWFTDAFRPANPARYAQIRDGVALTSPAGYIGSCQAIMDFDFAPRLSQVKAPVLVICGDQDMGTPPAENRRIAGLLADGRYEEIADARHFPNVERPDAFNRAMMGWLWSRRHLT
ncbi:MAG: alpha/beta fold hydrolase [Rhodospirillales bacterium]|nr:alpha/beta fold hydrolase [Rhodospirillales bacterium]